MLGLFLCQVCDGTKFRAVCFVSRRCGGSCPWCLGSCPRCLSIDALMSVGCLSLALQRTASKELSQSIRLGPTMSDTVVSQRTVFRRAEPVDEAQWDS